MLDDAHAREAIQKLQNVQNNIKIAIAVPAGLLLIVYFFTYAMFLDQGIHRMVWFEMITSGVLVLSLIKINRLSFVLLRLWYRNKSPHKEFLNKVSAADLTRAAQELVDFMK